MAKIAQYKRKLMDLSHRVLQVLDFLFYFFFCLFCSFGLQFFFLSVSCNKVNSGVSDVDALQHVRVVYFHSSFFCHDQVLIKQEIQRKSGYAIQVDEEHLRVQLDTIQSELNAPTQFKVKCV